MLDEKLMQEMKEEFEAANRPRAVSLLDHNDHIFKLYTDGSVYRLNSDGVWTKLPDDKKFEEKEDK